MPKICKHTGQSNEYPCIEPGDLLMQGQLPGLQIQGCLCGGGTRSVPMDCRTQTYASKP